jgi:outer membrane protein
MIRRLSRTAAVVACLVLAAWPAVAQSGQSAQPGPWSLEDCVKAAMQNQADVLTAQNNVTIARSRSKSALSDYFPQLTVQNNAFVAGSSKGVLNQTTTGTAFNVTQDVFDGGIRENSVQSARYGVKQNQAGLTRTVQTVTYSVTKSYYEVLRARHLADVAQKNVDYNDELLRQIQAQAEAGTSAPIDVLPVQAQLANAKVSLLSAQNSVRTAALALQDSMGLAPRPQFCVQEVETPPNPQMEALDAYMASALNARPDIAQSQAQIGASRASLRSARIGLYPRPVISGNYQRQIQGGFTTESTQMTGSIVFNLFDGGASRAAYTEAKANRANAELQANQLVKDIQTQVEEAYLNITDAQARTEASAIALQAAQTNYDNQMERRTLGSGTVLDVLNAEVQLVTAQSNDVQARYDYYVAIAQVNYAVGK